MGETDDRPFGLSRDESVESLFEYGWGDGEEGAYGPVEGVVLVEQLDVILGGPGPPAIVSHGWVAVVPPAIFGDGIGEMFGL